MPSTTVHIRDAISAILRDHAIEMTCEEIRRYLDPQPVMIGGFLRRRLLTAPEIYRHCRELALAGYAVTLDADPARDLPTRFMWSPPRPGTHRGIELWEADEFAALAALAGDPGPTR